MKICYLANARSIHTQKWVKYFVDKGYDIHLISFEKYPIENVEVHHLKRPLNIPHASLPFIFALIPTVKKMIKRMEPDVLHAHNLYAYGLCGALCGFKPFVATAWGSDVLFIPVERLGKYMVKRCIATYVAIRADLISVDSKSLMQEIIKLGASSKKIELITHGVNLKEFHPNMRSKTLKENLKIPDESPVVISTRHLEPIYDVKTLIKAIPYVLKHYPNAFFLIVSEGPLKRELQDLAKNLKIMDHVNFVGKVPHREVPIFLATSDIYVSTSLSDTTSVSLLEAMACELPVVVTSLEGNREWVKNGVNGFLIPRGDPKALGDRLVYLLRSETVRKTFGSISRGIVEEKASYQKEMRKMESFYKRLKSECEP